MVSTAGFIYLFGRLAWLCSGRPLAASWLHSSSCRKLPPPLQLFRSFVRSFGIVGDLKDKRTRIIQTRFKTSFMNDGGSREQSWITLKILID